MEFKLHPRSIVAQPKAKPSPAGRELSRYDEYMDHVRGLAPKTRSMALRIVGRLLTSQFGDGPVKISAIKPDHVRRFFAEQAKLYSKPANAGTVVASLRGYFRYRASRGDAVHGLVGVLSYPANWQLSSLPKTLTAEEVDQLVGALGQPGRSMRRADAIVRCALDLGLRSGEVAQIGLDDIDWRAGTITLRHTKSRREDVMPLPVATGKAIAAYLKHERPKTDSRAVFVRHNAPRGLPVGPDLVRKVIRQAYARAGLPYTRSHLLRHTMANRLLAGGSSLKEVADVLRHRSLNTTMIYAKLDSRKLIEVALPWPGSAS
jgi:integrase/recombinase XerC